MNRTVKIPKGHHKRQNSVQMLLRDLKTVIGQNKDIRTKKRKENYAGLYRFKKKKTFKKYH